MRQKILMTCLFVLAISLSACASPAAQPEDVVGVPSEAEPVGSQNEAGFYPLSTRTGIANVDAVLAAVESGDPQQLRDLFRYTTVGCTKADGLGGPPKCQDGEEEGTPVVVLPFLGPEGHFLREAEAANFPGVNVIGLYAVYKVSDSAYSDEAYPTGEYAVMFKGGENQTDVILQIRDGVVRIDYFYLSSLYELLQTDAAELILAP